VLLFVYGTLRSEFDNQYARMLRAHSELIGGATVTGSIFRVSDYPGYKPDPPGVVHGEVYRLNGEERILADLDAWEAPDFQRIAVRASNGEEVWIYSFLGEPPLADRIASGDFCAP